ncbi:MAG TPA: hypothetical protein ENF38_00640, partial [Candidatus Aenigmarchaeota archaeon]|nr:hypothetical protein [Candidatus Aenigmarchaeota archaeon]
MTKKEFYEQFERYQLSEFLPWIAYDPTNEVYLNVEVDTERIDVFRKVFNWLKGRHTAKGESAGLLWE